jgi:TetR/AcrR family transcriptional repressor of lmrAB and yxaGH operons
MDTPVRQRMLDTTARLLWRQGLRATGMEQIVRESRAPRGSIYFHFPKGKEQLAATALQVAGAQMTANITAALAHRNTRTALEKFLAVYGEELAASRFLHGDPIATVALEAAATSPALRTVCAGIFTQWERLLADRLRLDGFSPAKARSFAVVILSLLEGAMILCRTHQTTAPLKDVSRHLAATFRGR